MAALVVAMSIVALLTSGSSPAAAATKKHHHVAAKAGKAKKVRRRSDLPPVGARPIYESIVIDATTGRVLHQVNADTPSYPASLTKMMTLYMLFDALDKGKVHLDTPIKVSAHAASMAPSRLGLAPGSTIAVEQAIYAVVTKSANDVAVAIGEHLGGGSEVRFCAMMTARAHAIGMTRTHFANASGLPNKNQLSTARDMAILGKRLMTEFPQYFSYFSRTEFPYHGQMIHTHNHLLENYDGADGIKTGYTAASGFNLVASARRGDTRLITVVFGGTSAKGRDQHVAALMDAGFNVMATNPTVIANAQSVDPFQPSEAGEVEAADEDENPFPPTTGSVVAAARSNATETIAQGDSDDSIGQQIASLDPAPSAVAPALAETDTLVPRPGSREARTKHPVKAIAVIPEPAPANVTWGIQIGAYSNRKVAENTATEARDKVRSVFTAAKTRIVPVKIRAQKVLYRAQVVGLERKNIAKACRLVAKVPHSGCKTVSPDPARVAAH
jgi:D-alanyl-D-alanine carboxypeptidase